MDVELRHLKTLLAIVDAGSFTDAAIDLGVSQAAVSRTLASLEQALKTRLLHRTSRTIALTPTGAQLVPRARRLLAEMDELIDEATSGHARLRVGHAWSALGRYTATFQRRWAEQHPDVDLLLIRTNTPSGGLAEGACDLAIVRTPPDEKHFAVTEVGLERRFIVMAADDPWARRRTIRLDEVRTRTVMSDRRTGTTSADLWPTGDQPRFEGTADVDDWLARIAAGTVVGITPESTATQYRRAGVTFRPLRDAPPVAVRVIWPRQDPHPATQDAVALIAELYRS
ncbi:LysR family transcriptional regulator [Kribbella sp. CA-294648]|uniref:LysR family transcriptional regulator n=1 Tax=Kribbella sp. CA-294648 TaxID=3239948 RepID=UPI003D9023C0